MSRNESPPQGHCNDIDEEKEKGRGAVSFHASFFRVFLTTYTYLGSSPSSNR
jgi:hypothetical protein